MSTPLTTADPRGLHDERLQLHFAAWLVGSTAFSLLPALADDSQTNLSVASDGARLATRPLDASGLTLSLEIATLRLSWDRPDGGGEALELSARSMDEAWNWLNATRPTGAPKIAPRAYPDFPEHPLASGARFQAGDASARGVLGQWFAAGLAALAPLTAARDDADEPRVWPHHFDLGALIDLSGDGATSVGLGLSPGDGSYDEPYLYVSPYPQPAADALSPLPGPGHVHAAGFVAYVLTATELREAGGDPGAALGAFAEAAVQAALGIVGRAGAG